MNRKSAVALTMLLSALLWLASASAQESARSVASIGYGHGGPPWLVVLGTPANDDLRVSKAGDGSFLIEDPSGVEAQQLCVGETPALAHCPRMDSDYMNVLLGQGDDEIRISVGINGAVYGAEGRDRIIGAGVRGYLEGGDGADSLNGRGGNDIISGGGGPDRLLGGRGDDLLKARDGRPDRIIDCGPGDDRAFVDPSGDPKPIHCEAVISGRVR